MHRNGFTGNGCVDSILLGQQLDDLKMPFQLHKHSGLFGLGVQHQSLGGSEGHQRAIAYCLLTPTPG